jgi:hypothetical protein
MPDISDLRSTIVPKSDQLNAEQLLSGAITITVTDVRTGNDEQPVAIHYHGEDGRPYKPCKTMRKVLILAWGEDGRRWIGRSMTLFCDPSVRFGGVDVGGIRISHLSHIDRTKELSLTATRGKKAKHVIHLLETGPMLAEVLAAIKAATGRESMAKARTVAEQLTAPADIEQAQAAYKARADALKAKSAPAADPFAATLKRIEDCPDLQSLQAIGDELQEMPESQDRDALLAALLERDKALSA